MLDGGGRSTPHPSRFSPVMTRYPLCWGRGGPHGPSWWVRKISPPPGFDPGPSSPSLYRLRYPGPKKWNKGKQARCSPEGSRRFRLPDFHDIWYMKVVRSSASRTGRVYPQECSWYSFSLGPESTSGPWCGRKEICHWKIQWHNRQSISRPSD